MSRNITFYDEKEAVEYAKGLQKQGWNIAKKRSKDPQGEPIYIIQIYGTTRTIGRPAPASLGELYAEEESVAQRMILPPKLSRMKPEKLAGVLSEEAETKERMIARYEKRLRGVKSPEQRRELAEKVALSRARPSVIERAVAEEQRKLAGMTPEERIKRLVETRREGLARAEVSKYEAEQKLKETVAKELAERGLVEKKPLIPRMVEKAKLGKRLKIPTQFAKTGVKAVKEAGAMAGEVISPKTLGAVGKGMERQASMRKAIPVSAQMAQRQGKDYTYVARIGKVAAPAISEVSYPTQETIAQAPMQGSIAAAPRASIAQAPTSIAFRPRQPRIAGFIGVKSAGNIGDMPYLRRKKEEDSEEPIGNQPA